MAIDPTGMYESIISKCRELGVPDVPYMTVPDFYASFNQMLVSALDPNIIPNINPTIPLDIYEKLGAVKKPHWRPPPPPPPTGGLNIGVDVDVGSIPIGA